MDLKIQPVGIDYVAQTWPFVETYLKEALEKGEPVPEWSDNYDLSHVQGFLASGLWTLLVATDDSNQVHGAATVSFANYPKNRVAFITLIGGKLISNYYNDKESNKQSVQPSKEEPTFKQLKGGGFIAKGCGKVMSDRRKVTKMY